MKRREENNQLGEVTRNKKETAEKAVEFVKDGMVLGLGSGSTMYWTLKKLGELIADGLQVKGVPTSKRTAKWANEFNIPLTDFSKVEMLDLAIDGADEIDGALNLVKGGGGSLVREKIVDTNADKLIIVADESKMVSELGAFPLPVEVVPFGWQMTAKAIEKLGCAPALRKKGGRTFISDNGNYILDCSFTTILQPTELEKQIKQIVGVVETGLFIGITDQVIIGKKSGVELLKKS